MEHPEHPNKTKLDVTVDFCEIFGFHVRTVFFRAILDENPTMSQNLAPSYRPLGLDPSEVPFN